MTYYRGGTTDAYLRNRENTWFARDNHVKLAKWDISPNWVNAQGWNPADLFGEADSGLTFSFEPGTVFTDTGMTTEATFGDVVGAAADQSGKDNHVLQATEAAKPIYTRHPKTGVDADIDDPGYTGNQVRHGLYDVTEPGVQDCYGLTFDGIDDILITGNALDMSATSDVHASTGYYSTVATVIEYLWVHAVSFANGRTYQAVNNGSTQRFVSNRLGPTAGISAAWNNSTLPGTNEYAAMSAAYTSGDDTISGNIDTGYPQSNSGAGVVANLSHLYHLGARYGATGFLDGVIYATTYINRVLTVDEAFQLDQWTMERTPVVAPPRPDAISDLAAVAGDAIIDLTWTPPSSSPPVTSQTLQRSLDGVSGWASVASLGAAATSYQDTDLTNSTTYYYRIAGVNSGGTGDWSNIASATPVAVPVGPIIRGLSNEDYGTTADYFVDAAVGSSGDGLTPATAFKTIQEGVNAVVADGVDRVVSVLAGTYREAVNIRSKTSHLTLQAYGTDRPRLTGMEAVTGWVQCTIADEPLLGANYASIYKVNVPTSSLAVGHQATNVYENGVAVPYSQTKLPGTELFYTTNDADFARADAFNVNGSNQILSIDDASELDGLPSAGLMGQAFVQLYISGNTTKRVNITAYDDVNDRIDVDGLHVWQGSDPDVWRYNLLNCAAKIEQGTFAAYDEGNSTVTFYIWPTSAANLTANVEMSARPQMIDATNMGEYTIQGFELTGHASDARRSSQAINGHSDSLVSKRAGNIVIRNNKFGKHYNSDGAGYGPVYMSLVDDVTIENNEWEWVDGAFGCFVSGSASQQLMCSNVIVSKNKVRENAQAGFRMFGVTLFQLTYNDVRHTGKAGHANAWNFYEYCDLVLVKGNWYRDLYGYGTFQECSRLFICDNVQTIGQNATTSLIDQSNQTPGPVTAGTSYVWNNVYLPNNGEMTQQSTNGGASLGKHWEDLGVADADHPYNNRYEFVNNVTWGGGVSEPYGTPDANQEYWADRVPPVDTEPRREGNVYANLTYWQHINYGWTIDASEVSNLTVSEVFTDATGGDYTAPAGSPILTHTGQEVAGIVAIAQSHFPTVDFSIDGDGVPIPNQSTRKPGAFVDYNSVMVGIGFDAAPNLPAQVTDWSAATGTAPQSIAITIGTEPDDGGSPITAMQYDVDGDDSWASIPAYAGVGTYDVVMAAGSTSYDIRVRAVTANGAGPASATDTATSAPEAATDYVPLTADQLASWSSANAPWGADTNVTKILFAFEAYGIDTADSFHGLFAADASVDFEVLYTDSNGQLRVNLGASNWRVTGGIPISGTTRTRFIMSIDTTAATGEVGIICYNDDNPTATSSIVWTQNTALDQTAATIFDALRDRADRPYTGEIAFLYFDTPAVLPDITQQAVRDQFTAENIGADGSGPTGAQPQFYMTGDRAAWEGATNLGSLTGFAVNGSFLTP